MFAAIKLQKKSPTGNIHANTNNIRLTSFCGTNVLFYRLLLVFTKARDQYEARHLIQSIELAEAGQYLDTLSSVCVTTTLLCMLTPTISTLHQEGNIACTCTEFCPHMCYHQPIRLINT